MKIDLNSPVEVWRIDAPNTGFPSCELTLFNLSGQQVVSVEVTLTLLDPDGQEITRITHRAHGLTGAPMRTFSMTVPVEEPANVGGCEAIIEKVWYDNSSIWRRGKEPLTEYTPNNLHRSTALSELREVAGNMAADIRIDRATYGCVSAAVRTPCLSRRAPDADAISAMCSPTSAKKRWTP